MNGFRITWRGSTFTDADVLVGDLVTVQMLLGGEWANFTPWTGPAQTSALTAALVARATGRDLGEVVEEIRTAPAVELLDAIEPTKVEEG